MFVFTVLTHPLFVYRNFEKRKLEKEEIQVILQYLKTCGLDGIEANYSAFDSSENRLARTAITAIGTISISIGSNALQSPK